MWQTLFFNLVKFTFSYIMKKEAEKEIINKEVFNMKTLESFKCSCMLEQAAAKDTRNSFAYK